MTGLRVPGTRRDDGTVLPLAIGSVLLVLTVVLVLTDTSSLFMRRAALLNVADGVAIAATNGIDVAAIYEKGVGERLRIDPALANELAEQAVRDARDPRLRDIRLDAIVVSDSEATVFVSAAVPNPLARITGERDVRLRARASAQVPTRF